VTSESNSQQPSGSQISSTESRRGGWNGSVRCCRFFPCLRISEPAGQQIVWPEALGAMHLVAWGRRNFTSQIRLHPRNPCSASSRAFCAFFSYVEEQRL
jgi:hypothetical protein